MLKNIQVVQNVANATFCEITTMKNPEVLHEEINKEKIKELDVFTKAKKLCEYNYVITKNVPKQFRWNIVDKLLKYSLELVEDLYFANDLQNDERYEKQRQIDTKLKLVGYFSLVGETVGAISSHQADCIGTMILDARRSLWKWIKSNRTV